MKISDIIDKTNFTKNEILYLLNQGDDSDQNLLFEKAEMIEKEFCNSPVSSYGLIKISTYCSKNCNYCRFRKDNKSIIRERINRERIIEIAKEIKKSGIKSIVIRSCYDDFYDQDRIAYIIYSIKEYSDVDIMLGLGERSFEEYKEWKIAGANGYRLRFKSSNPNIYDSLNTSSSFDRRIEHIDQLKSLGYQVCSGSILGLPNQTFGDIAEDIQLCQILELNITELLPFIPQINTPFQYLNPWGEEDIKKVMAVARIVLKEKIRNSNPNYVFNLEKHAAN